MSRLLIVACLMFVGCATSYQSGKYSFTGGYLDTYVNDHLRKVGFYGNGFTQTEVVRKYAKFRCAELADAQKKPYFTMYASLNEAAIGRPTSQPTVGFIGGKPVGYAYISVNDAWTPGALKTSDVLAELEQMRAAYKEAAAANASKKSTMKSDEK